MVMLLSRIDFNLFRLSFLTHTGQIHAAFKGLLGEQIRHKLIAFEGQAKLSKINYVMKWRPKRISIVIAKTKTASRNVAFNFKAARGWVIQF